MSKPFSWEESNAQIIQQNCSEKRFLAFDTTYMPKSGKKTSNVGRYWIGKDKAVKPSIDFGAIAVVEIQNGTALSLESVQTPPPQKKTTAENFMDHYTMAIIERLPVFYH